MLALHHEGTDTLSRLDQPFVAQLRNRFAHDGAAHAEGLGHRMLCRQLVTGFQHAIINPLGELRGDPRWQVIRAGNLLELIIHHSFLISSQVRQLSRSIRHPGFIVKFGSIARLIRPSRSC